MVGPTKRKPRSTSAALIASDSRDRAGRSRSVRRRYCFGVPPTKPQRKSPNEPLLSWKSRKARALRSEEHTSELQSLTNLVCRRLLEKKKKTTITQRII